MTCRIEVFVRSGHTIDLALEDGEDSAFTTALHQAWASPGRAEGFTHLALGANAVVWSMRLSVTGFTAQYGKTSDDCDGARLRSIERGFVPTTVSEHI